MNVTHNLPLEIVERLQKPPRPNKKGYVYFYHRGRLILEHRFVMSVSLGRPLVASEIVHHRNHDPGDNRLENLTLCTRREHRILHKGMPIRQPVRLSREHLVEQLKKYATHVGVPTPKIFARGNTGYPSLHTYQRRFGSWSRALRAAGLKPQRLFKISEHTGEEILQLREQGLSGPAIGIQLGISSTTVYSYWDR